MCRSAAVNYYSVMITDLVMHATLMTGGPTGVRTEAGGLLPIRAYVRLNEKGPHERQQLGVG